MKKNINSTITEMKKMVTCLPKTVKEGLTFEGGDVEFEAPEQEVQNDTSVQDSMDGGMNVEAFVDDIRKKALKGMAQLADNPEDQRYQILKKIWQICDKKPDDQQNQVKSM